MMWVQLQYPQPNQKEAMDKLKQVWGYIASSLLIAAVGVIAWIGLRRQSQPEIAGSYDPLRNLIDSHFDELGKLKKDRIKIRIQRMQIEENLSKIEINDFKNAVLAAVDAGDVSELAAIRSRYLRKYDIHRDAENDTTGDDS
jgi:tRNA threonylcarbamoyladenosine modification (KEOPS) complex  Pcc1 subunit